MDFRQGRLSLPGPGLDPLDTGLLLRDGICMADPGDLASPVGPGSSPGNLGASENPKEKDHFLNFESEDFRKKRQKDQFSDGRTGSPKYIQLFQLRPEAAADFLHFQKESHACNSMLHAV